MMRFAPWLLGVPALLFGMAAMAADGPPKLDVETSCRAAAESGVNGRNRDACLSEENDARSTLAQHWAQYSAAQQSRCTDLVRMGGPPSYVELLTCLDMAEQARKLPDADTLKGSVGPASTGGKSGLRH
jgi:hypothetical protein